MLPLFHPYMWDLFTTIMGYGLVIVIPIEICQNAVYISLYIFQRLAFRRSGPVEDDSISYLQHDRWSFCSITQIFVALTKFGKFSIIYVFFCVCYERWRNKAYEKLDVRFSSISKSAIAWWLWGDVHTHVYTHSTINILSLSLTVSSPACFQDVCWNT